MFVFLDGTLIVPETADYLYDALLAARTTVLVFARRCRNIA